MVGEFPTLTQYHRQYECIATDNVALFALRHAGVGIKFGLPFLLKMYFVPYWIFVMWLDVVTYLHHTAKEVRVSFILC